MKSFEMPVTSTSVINVINVKYKHLELAKDIKDTNQYKNMLTNGYAQPPGPPVQLRRLVFGNPT